MSECHFTKELSYNLNFFFCKLKFQLYSLVTSRPTAIVEPSLSIRKSKSFSDYPLKTRIQTIPFPIRHHHHSPWIISTHDESDTGISSFNSTDDQLVTLV